MALTPYPIGIEWLEPTARLKVGDETEPKDNTSLHLMVSNWVDNNLEYVLSDTIANCVAAISLVRSSRR